jgi:hypothetical protein
MRDASGCQKEVYVRRSRGSLFHRPPNRSVTEANGSVTEANGSVPSQTGTSPSQTGTSLRRTGASPRQTGASPRRMGRIGTPDRPLVGVATLVGPVSSAYTLTSPRMIRILCTCFMALPLVLSVGHAADDHPVKVVWSHPVISRDHLDYSSIGVDGSGNIYVLASYRAGPYLTKYNLRVAGSNGVSFWERDYGLPALRSIRRGIAASSWARRDSR